MTPERRGTALRRRWLGLSLIAIAATIAACGDTPRKDMIEAVPHATATGGASTRVDTAATTDVTTDGFESLGPIELTVWSYENQKPGLQNVIEDMTKTFMEKHPNVKVTLEFKGFNDLTAVINRALASGHGPDITEGNHGSLSDAEQVKAKLILPLDPYVKAYGWDEWWGADTWQSFQWTEDGKTLGQGPIWGIAQTGQNVALFYNKQKLTELGIDPAAIPATFADFDTALALIRSKLAADQPVFEFGNKEGYGTIHFIGGLQGAYGDAQSLRDWIYHVPGSTFETDQNLRALAKLAEWAKNGYFNKDFNAIGYDDAAKLFAKGTGVFFVGGNWETAVIEEGLGDNAGVINMPPGPSGKHVGVGATSGPWHISAKTQYPDVAAAWLNYIHSAPEAIDSMFSFQQIPAVAGATPPAGNAFLGEVTASWQQLVADGGLTLYADWASPSMYDTLANQYQLVMAGTATPEDAAKAIQADWQKFDDELKAG